MMPSTRSPDAPLAIEVRGLSKRYGAISAVDDISFGVGAGQTVALLGGNGAGKTTTLSMLLGLLLPSAGTIRVLGEDMVHHRYRVLSQLNFSSPYIDLPHRLSVRENMTVYAHLYGIQDVRGRITELARDLNIETLPDRPCGKLS
ncbi:MAG: ABC-2 type transport system ATP-binding protein, partial [Rhodospirillaceae bacterium]